MKSSLSATWQNLNFRFLWFIIIFFAVDAAPLWGETSAGCPPPPELKNLRGVEVSDLESALQVDLIADGFLAKHTVFTLPEPQRIVIDLFGVHSN